MSYDPKWERKGSHIKPFPKHHENLTLLWSIKSGISSIWMNRVLDVRIYLFWNLDTWAHSKIIKDCMDEGKTPLLLGKFHETMWGGGKEGGSPEWAPLLCPKMSCFCFMVCPSMFSPPTWLIFPSWKSEMEIIPGCPFLKLLKLPISFVIRLSDHQKGHHQEKGKAIRLL